MKPVLQIINEKNQQWKGQDESRESFSQTLTVGQLRELGKIWAFMTENYADLWIHKYGTVPNDENSRSWVLALRGLTKNQISTGLEQTINQCSDYPPLPPKFRSLCLLHEEDEADALFQELVNWGQLDQSQKTQKGLFIVRNIDYTLFRRADDKKAKQMFNGVYSKLLKHLAEGKELPEFAVEIEYEEKPPMPKEQMKGFLAELTGFIDSVRGV